MSHLPPWLERAAELETSEASRRVPFAEAKKFFAVDASASTMGGIMDKQRDYVLGLSSTKNDAVCLWHTRCDIPRVSFTSDL